MTETKPIVTSAPRPVRVSGNAVRDMTKHLRRWSGWDNATLTFGPTIESVSPYAHTDRAKREVVCNVDRLLLNPNRVLNVINPFRLRQEAVLTGALIHEAAHARYSMWQPRTPEEFKALHHGSGAPVSKQTLAFARLLEEPRIEGCIAFEARTCGIEGLEWTMRAMAAAVLPNTNLSADPDQQIMEVIESWVLRAGRQFALVAADPDYVVPDWANDFTTLVHETVLDYLTAKGVAHPLNDTMVVMNTLREMTRCVDHTGTTMVDKARRVLEVLFPETDEPPMPSGGCGSAGAGGDGAPSDSGTPSEDKDEASQSGASDAAGKDESDEQGSGAGEDQSSESGAQSEETEAGEADSDADDEAAALRAILAAALRNAEGKADRAVTGEAKVQPKADPKPAKGVGSGKSGVTVGGTWRTPTAEERETQANAAKFLRDLINPTETSRRHLSETPSAQVDGAALAAWRAAGERTDPMFFIRTRREVTPAPPIKIAILVDVSGSMDAMQKPSCLLSWALASAAYDLRNFAGRGRQIESTLIHWGDDARVIQPNGVMLPGLREVECRELTNAMGNALALIESEIPGFFDVGEKPENRLLVHFTDWGLGNQKNVGEYTARAMEAGVNMLSVTPHRYYHDVLGRVLKSCPIKRGRNDVIAYNPLFPEAIWDEAKKVLTS